MDIRQLTYFMHVVELGSFSRAAAFLHIAQPALGRQISSLETELKERLLIRNGRGVSPTEAGARLLDHARSIIQLFERAHEDMENARLGRTGAVAIGMPGSLSAQVSTGLIRKLHAEIPDAKVHVLTGRSTQLQEWLLAGRLDFIMNDPVVAARVVAEAERAGVRILGTADSPQLQLYSSPQLADAETLSWIVLGRSAAGGGADAGAATGTTAAADETSTATVRIFSGLTCSVAICAAASTGSSRKR